MRSESVTEKASDFFTVWVCKHTPNHVHNKQYIMTTQYRKWSYKFKQDIT